ARGAANADVRIAAAVVADGARVPIVAGRGRRAEKASRGRIAHRPHARPLAGSGRPWDATAVGAAAVVADRADVVVVARGGRRPGTQPCAGSHVPVKHGPVHVAALPE